MENTSRRRNFFFVTLVVILCRFSPAVEGPLVIEDTLSRKVRIHGRIERIISLQPETTRLILAIGGQDYIAGVDYFIHKNDHLFRLLYPQNPFPVVSVSAGSVNLESVMRLKPDVIFASPLDIHTVDMIQRKTGIPVVALSSMGRFGGLEQMMTLMGKILRREERAQNLVDLIASRIQNIKDRLVSVSEDDKPRVYLAFWSQMTRTPVYYEPVSAAGGVNVAENLRMHFAGNIGTSINIEKLLIWDPDFILVHGNYLPSERILTVERILGDNRLASLEAVKNKRVRYTFGFWYWWEPAQVVVETLYLAKLFYPGLFEDVDLVSEGNALYEMFYSVREGFTRICQKLGCDGWSDEE